MTFMIVFVTSFGIGFWLVLVSILAPFWDPLASNFMLLGDSFFYDFLNRFLLYFLKCLREKGPKTGPRNLPGLRLWPPKKIPKSIPVANSISYRVCIDLGLHFNVFFMIFDTLVGAFFRSWCWFTVPRRFQNPILSIWICRSPLGAAVAPRAYNDFWHHFFDQFSWPPKSRNLQQV